MRISESSSVAVMLNFEKRIKSFEMVSSISTRLMTSRKLTFLNSKGTYFL